MMDLEIRSKNPITEIWESANEYQITEEKNDSVVDGINILARVVGPAFFPNTTSGNNVFYSKEAWNNAVNDKEFQYLLENRLIYGTIGHNIELTDDSIREGMVSHIVSKVWIDEDGTGKAEYLILNTETGRVLNTLLRAKSKLRVSTKAFGDFIRESKSDGVTRVDPNNFFLDRIDFVRLPGYKEALPSVIESENKKKDITNINHGNKQMEINESKTVSILESQIADLKAENKSLKSVQESHGQKNTELALAMQELNNYHQFGTVEAIQESLRELRAYQEIGTVQKIMEELEDGIEQIDQLTQEVTALKEEDEEQEQELGSPEEIKDAVELALSVVDELKAYRDLGEPEEIEQALDQAEEIIDAIQELGTVDEIEQLVDQTEELQDELGTPEEIEQALDELEAYSELGTPEEIEQVLDDAEELVEEALKARAEKRAAQIADLSKKTSIKESLITDMLSKGMTEQEISEMAAQAGGYRIVNEEFNESDSNNLSTRMFKHTRVASKSRRIEEAAEPTRIKRRTPLANRLYGLK